MDERELETLFRAAPGEPPAPGFTLEDVTRVSARTSARHRTRLWIATACVIAVAGSGGLAAVYLRPGSGASDGQPVAAPARPH
ncbi:hypothetical protein FNH05_33785, partial [Amycolatopsis rhizosphaerae]